MPKVIIKDVPGLDGEYELDLVFTHRDFRTIKQLTGVRANEVMDALNAGDLDIVVALADIALTRAGHPHHIDQLWDAVAGSLTLDVTDEEEDVSPPPSENEPEKSDSEPKSDFDSKASGDSTNGATASSPETSTPDSSGIQQPAVSLVPPTSTT